jgi:hypothetical protein
MNKSTLLAQEIKKALKKEFPLLKVSCTLSRYAGGRSVNVDCQNLLTTNYNLKDITEFCESFKDAETTFIFVSAGYSEEVREELEDMAIQYLEAYDNITGDEDGQYYEGYDCSLWEDLYNHCCYSDLSDAPKQEVIEQEIIKEKTEDDQDAKPVEMTATELTNWMLSSVEEETTNEETTNELTTEFTLAKTTVSEKTHKEIVLFLIEDILTDIDESNLIAQAATAELEANYQRLENLAQKATAKYPLL